MPSCLQLSLYNQTMAAPTNAMKQRLVSVFCLLAILFVAMPYATCAATAGHSMANMPAGHCDPCCPSKVASTALCCLAHPQPATPAVQSAPLGQIVVASDLPAQSFAQPAPLGVVVVTNQNLPPPLLRTNLRI